MNFNPVKQIESFRENSRSGNKAVFIVEVAVYFIGFIIIVALFAAGFVFAWNWILLVGAIVSHIWNVFMNDSMPLEAGVVIFLVITSWLYRPRKRSVKITNVDEITKAVVGVLKEDGLQ